MGLSLLASLTAPDDAHLVLAIFAMVLQSCIRFTF